MSGRFAKIRAGLEEHLVTGLLSAFDVGVYLILHLQADMRTGIWIGSAPRLLATAPRGRSRRDMQRALSRLAQIEFIRSFHRHGVRGNYRVLLHKFEPQFGALKGKRLNAMKSESWKAPIYEVCAVSDALVDTIDDALPRTETAPYQDLRYKNIRSKEPYAPTKEPSQGGCFLAALLKRRILQNNPTAHVTETHVKNWAQQADVMINRDGRTEMQIEELIEWSQADSFWKGNILSMKKLREKFDQLTVKKNSSGTGAFNNADERTRANLRAAGLIP